MQSVSGLKVGVATAKYCIHLNLVSHFVVYERSKFRCCCGKYREAFASNTYHAVLPAMSSQDQTPRDNAANN